MTKADIFARGLAKVKENDHHAAITLFSAVLKEEPENADALSQRAVCYLNLEQYDLSMQDMNLAIKYDPQYAFRYQCRGYLKARLQDFEGAVEDYQKAVDLDPKDSIAYNNLALAQDQLGWAGKAKRNYDKSDELAGVKTAEERAKAREEKPALTESVVQPDAEETPDKAEIVKSVFTKKNSFREFIRFIGNGFKLKEDDKS